MAIKTHKERTKTVLQIVRDYLKDNKYDGLLSHDGDCYCAIKDLCDCMLHNNCRPYRKVVSNKERKACLAAARQKLERAQARWEAARTTTGRVRATKAVNAAYRELQRAKA